MQKLSADKKGGGADHHEVVKDKGVLECDDSDVCLNQMVEKKSQNGNRKILYRYGWKPRMDQYREDCQIYDLRKGREQDRYFSRITQIRVKRKIREHVERISAEKFINKQFRHTDPPGLSNRNTQEIAPAHSGISDG